MRRAVVKVIGQAPYSQSRYHASDKLNKEGADAYEQRTWIEKAHWDEQGRMVIPALAFKNAISEAAKYLSEQVPGKGKATYTKHFESGVTTLEDSLITLKNGKPVTRDSVMGDRLHVPADGRRGGGSRVIRIFPTIPVGWSADIEYIILDDTITEDVFRRTITTAGLLIGVGSFRVRNNGIRGRFAVESIDWEDNYNAAIAA